MNYVSKTVSAVALSIVSVFFLCSCTGGGGSTPASLQSIQVTPAEPAVEVRMSTKLDATGAFSNSTTHDISSSVTWTLSDDTRATVNANGLATGISAGTTIVTAIDVATGISGTALLTVTPARTFTLPDTGLTTCHTGYGTPISCTGTGQDGLYSINSMSFTDNGDGTVTDTVTGLMWQKCSAGQTDYSLCSGPATTYNWYVASGTHNVTSNPSSTSVCGALSLGENYDWRLPEKSELIRLINYATSSPALDGAYFPNTNGNYYWSSTGYATLSTYAWDVNFGFGYDDYDSMTAGNAVRCVRGSSPAQDFTDNGNGTVNDNVTGLMWQKCSSGQDALTCNGTPAILAWSAALDYCNALSFSGYTDWRLPNVKELESLVDSAVTNPAINTAFFPNTFGATGAPGFWSSTTHVYPKYNKWAVSFYSGSVFASYYTNTLYVRCVR